MKPLVALLMMFGDSAGTREGFPKFLLNLVQCLYMLYIHTCKYSNMSIGVLVTSFTSIHH